MDEAGDPGESPSSLLSSHLPSHPTPYVLPGPFFFLLFLDGTHLISGDREAQEQGETDTKVSVPRKKAIATLKVTGCWGEGSPWDLGSRVVTEAPRLSDLQQLLGGRV